MTRLLLFGKKGQLGWELQRTLACLGDVTALDYPEVDFTQPVSLQDVVASLEPDLIVNPAAYTAVDQAEAEPQKAALINGVAPGILAEAARQNRAVFIHFSTDYVFDGMKNCPYIETDEPNPLNVYGRTKLAGEQAVREAGGAWLVFRTTWVYSLREGGFVNKVLGWATKNEVLRIVTDQVSGPTSSRMLAEAIALLIAKMGENPYDWTEDRRGLYHLAGDDYASRYEWAQAILEMDPNPQKRKVRELLPAASEEFPTPAVRPLFSALDCSKFADAFGFRLPHWREGLRLMLESYAEISSDEQGGWG